MPGAVPPTRGPLCAGSVSLCAAHALRDTRMNAEIAGQRLRAKEPLLMHLSPRHVSYGVRCLALLTTRPVPLEPCSVPPASRCDSPHPQSRPSALSVVDRRGRSARGDVTYLPRVSPPRSIWNWWAWDPLGPRRWPWCAERRMPTCTAAGSSNGTIARLSRWPRRMVCIARGSMGSRWHIIAPAPRSPTC